MPKKRILEWVAISFSDRIRSRILFIYLFRLCWVFVVACRLSLVAVSVGSSLQWLFLQSTGSRHTGSVLVVHGLSCPVQLCDPVGCCPPGSSVHVIFQARILEWGVIAFSGIRNET